MKWKAFCCLIFAVSVLTLSFYLPEQFLHRQQENMIGLVETRPVEEVNINSYTQSNMEKLKIISSPTATASWLDYRIDNTDEILDQLNRELNTLREMGLCKQLLDFGDLEADEISDIRPIMYMDHQKFLHVYDIETSVGQFRMDVNTGKLLELKLFSKFQIEDMRKTVKRWKDSDETYLDDFVRWAEYYDLIPVMAFKGNQGWWDHVGSHLMMYGNFTDELGQQVGMVASYSEDPVLFSISSRPMERIIGIDGENYFYENYDPSA